MFVEHVALDVLVPDGPHVAFRAVLMFGFDFGMHRKVSPCATACQLQKLGVLNNGLIQGLCQDRVGAFFVNGTQNGASPAITVVEKRVPRRELVHTVTTLWHSRMGVRKFIAI